MKGRCGPSTMQQLKLNSVWAGPTSRTLERILNQQESFQDCLRLWEKEGSQQNKNSQRQCVHPCNKHPEQLPAKFSEAKMVKTDLPDHNKSRCLFWVRTQAPEGGALDCEGAPSFSLFTLGSL